MREKSIKRAKELKVKKVSTYTIILVMISILHIFSLIATWVDPPVVDRTKSYYSLQVTQI